MFKLGGLFVELQAKDAAFNQTLDRAKDRAQATGTAIEGTSFSMSGGAGGTDVGAMAASMGPMAAQLRAALAGALEPLQGMAARLGAMFDRVGGAVITVARRIDQSMKFSASKAAVEKLRSSLANLVKTGATANWPALRKLQQDLIAIAPAAGVALQGFKALAAARNYFGSRGDVASRSLSELKGMKFDPVAQSARGAASAVGTIGTAAQKATGHVRAFGGSVLVALGFFGAAYKLVEFFRGGIKGAVDLGETVSKTREVFGNFTDQVTAQADAMARQYGLVKGPLLDAASSIGLIAQGAGLSERASAGMANSLSKLAADASSFYNVPMDAALEKIRAGLIGESEPLRAFGVMLTEEAVAAAAVAQGFAKSAKEVDNTAKVKARALLIEQGLAAASGDLERTQDSAANQFRKLAGSVREMAIQIGQVLLPAVRRVIGLLNGLVTVAGSAFERNRAVLERFGATLVSIVATVGEAFAELPRTFAVFRGDLEAALGATGAGALLARFVAGVRAAVAQFGVVLRNLPEYAAIARLEVRRQVDAIPEYYRYAAELAGAAWAYVADRFRYVGDVIRAEVMHDADVIRYFGEAAAAVAQYVTGYWGAVFGPTFSFIAEAVQGLAAVFAAVAEAIVTPWVIAFGAIVKAGAWLVETLGGALIGTLGGIFSWLGGVARAFGAITRETLAEITRGLAEMTKSIETIKPRLKVEPPRAFQLPKPPDVKGYEQQIAVLYARIAENEAKRREEFSKPLAEPKVPPRLKAALDGKAKLVHEVTVETSGLAEFASRLRQKQQEGKNEALKANTDALQKVRDAVDLNTDALGKGATAVYA